MFIVIKQLLVYMKLYSIIPFDNENIFWIFFIRKKNKEVGMYIKCKQKNIFSSYKFL